MGLPASESLAFLSMCTCLFKPVSPTQYPIWPTRRSYTFKVIITFRVSVQFSSVTQLCPTLCDPMNHSTPGLPVHHQLPEFTQTHIHRVSDAIQPSHPLPSPSPSIFPSIRLFSNQSVFHIRWPKYQSFSFSISPSNEYPGLIPFQDSLV